METFRNIWRQKYPGKIISSAKVDKDVQSMLLSLNLMEYIMLCPRYAIKDNDLTSNSLYSCVISLLGTLMFIFSLVYRVYMVSYYNYYNGGPPTMYFVAFFDCVLYLFEFFMNFVNGILLTEKSIKFVITFQKLHRFLNNETSFNHFIVRNWIIVIAYILGHTIFFITFCESTGGQFFVTLSVVVLVVLDLNMIYATRVIRMLENKVVLWNMQALKTQELKDVNRENNSKEMFQAYVNVLKCYNIHKFCFQHIVST